MAAHEIFSCAICSKVFETRSRFNQHSKTHSKPWKCEICSQGFALRTDLNRHTKSKHRVGHQLFSCNECKSTYKRKDNLKYHIRTRHATSPRFPEKRSSPSTTIDQAAEPLPDWLLLAQSASSGNLTYVEHFIHLGHDIELRADDGNTALHCAARAGQISVLHVLIQYGAKVNVTNDKGRFPIYEALIEGHLDCVILLLQAGTSLKELFVPAYGAQKAFAEHIVRTGNCELVDAFLTASSDSRFRLKVFLRLRKAAAKTGQVAILHYLYNPDGIGLSIGPEDVDRILYQDLLRHAVRNGQTLAVIYLLPLYQRKKLLFRYLTAAAMAGHAEICKILLADSPAMDLNDALYVAAQRGRLPVLEVLMSHQGAVMAHPYIDLKKPILAALWNDSLDSLRYLVANNNWIAQPNGSQYDALSRVELVKCLLQHGLLKISDEAKQHISYFRLSGTLLHLAVEHNDLDLARYVIQHESFDSSILEKNCRWDGYYWTQKRTALDHAQLHGRTEIASLLIAHGAINHNTAPEESPWTEQNPAQSSSQHSDNDHEMHEDSDYESESDTEPLQAQRVSQDISDTSNKKLSISYILES